MGIRRQHRDFAQRAWELAIASGTVSEGECAMPLERFVSCCTTLQLAAREVARVAFLQVSRERPTALLGLSAIWAALVVCFIRSLSINPLSIRPLHRWIYDVNAVLEMATIWPPSSCSP